VPAADLVLKQVGYDDPDAEIGRFGTYRDAPGCRCFGKHLW
jgi:hypothetical protein